MVVTLPGVDANGDWELHSTTSTGSSVALVMNFGLPGDGGVCHMMQAWTDVIAMLRDRSYAIVG
jgi:hypothetical protein